jgi:hypothetical protein
MGLDRLVKPILSGKPKLSAEQLRGARPVRNPEVTESVVDDKLVLHGVAVRRNFLEKLLIKSDEQARKGYELEEVGSFVWACIDGKTSFEKISRELQKRYKMKRLEADASLEAFLKMLSDRGLITLLVKN